MPGFSPSLGTGFGISTLIYVITIIVIAVMWWRGRRNSYVSGTPIVLKRFHVNEDPSANLAVEIGGRISGILSWVLNVLRLEPEFELTVTNTHATIRSGSLSGIVYTYVPLGKISATICGYQRSIVAFGFGILFSVGFLTNLLSGFFENDRSQVGSDMGYAFGFLILAAICALIYFLSKRVGVGIYFETSSPRGFIFKRSVIENVSVDLPEALRLIGVINSRILAAQEGYTQGKPVATLLPTQRVPPSRDDRASGRCPACSTVNPIDVRFCENCGAALPA